MAFNKRNFPTSGEEAFKQMLQAHNITNFSADELGWYVMAIERCGYSGFYIEETACDIYGNKTPGNHALMLIGSYYGLPCDFFGILEELRAKYPVCPEISIQDVMFGQSSECLQMLKRIEENKEILVEAFDKALRQWNNA